MVERDEVRVMCMIQVLFKRRCMREDELKQVCQRVMGTSNEPTMKYIMGEMGERLSVLKLQVKSFTHFNDGEKYVALVNTVGDAAAKLSSRYEFKELQFFHHILERVAMSPDAEEGVCSLDSRDALNVDTAVATQMTQHLTQEQLGGKNSAMNIGQKQAALKKLQDDQWLGDVNGRVTIGPRSFLELKDHLLALDLPEATKQRWHETL